MSTDPTPPAPPTAADLAIDAAALLARAEGHGWALMLPSHLTAGILRRLVAAEAEVKRADETFVQAEKVFEEQREAHAALAERCEAWKELARILGREDWFDAHAGRIAQLRQRLGEEA